MESRSEEISKIVTRAITNKQLLPGSKLREQALADVFDVSRAVIRQALIKLSDDGLVTMARNRGAFVTMPSYRDAVEIYEALTILEQGVAAQLSGRLGPQGWAELRRHVALQHQAIADGNDQLSDQLGLSFHEILVSFSSNTVIKQVHAQLIRRTALLRALVGSRLDYCGLIDDHEELIDFLERGKVVEAQALIETHHANVVRGYHIETGTHPEIDAAAVLAQYVPRSCSV